jgi:hypothetical protein
LNSARIREEAKPRKISKLFPEKLVRSGKSLKNDKNEYKSSLGGCKQKQIGAMNSARIGENFSPVRSPIKLKLGGDLGLVSQIAVHALV